MSSDLIVKQLVIFFLILVSLYIKRWMNNLKESKRLITLLAQVLDMMI